jgi:pilus assembly protein CpaC
LALIDTIVSSDISALKSALHDALPTENIDVRAVNDSIVLSGVVSSPGKIAQAVEIAKSFVPKDKLINQLRVEGSQQVMLHVKVAEMSRSLSKDLGFKPMVNQGNNASGFSFTTLDPVNLTNYALAVGKVVSGNYTVQLALDALEERGAVKVLAEPDLVALSGDTASFLAGGEFPVPVAQTLGIGGVPTITVEFKPFGVSLAFTPTVLDGGLINLAVAPEVSELDKTNSFNLNGLVIPGIATRRARTTVEIRDGQSFAIAGLLQNSFRDNVRGVPGLSSLPIIGALLRSSQYQRNETELVIIVTPTLVQPVQANAVIAPTDSFVPPSDFQFFVAGRTENPDSGVAPPAGGGLTGKYGHIIR